MVLMFFIASIAYKMDYKIISLGLTALDVFVLAVGTLAALIPEPQ